MSKKSLKVISSESYQNSDNSFNSSRRNFLKIIGAASAATAVGCADSAKQNILGHVKGNQHEIPGESVWYRSVCRECNAGCGISVRTREGRAVKIEGNPDHPINKGSLCALGQSALQHLYDPDRVRQPMQRTATGSFEPITWDAALQKITGAVSKKAARGALLTSSSNASQAQLINDWCKAFNAEHFEYEAFDQVALAKATEIVYGQRGVPQFNFSEADFILNFGADFLETWISPVEYARGWAVGRKRNKPAKFLHIEPRLSLTGANADRWFGNKPGSELPIALAILDGLIRLGKTKNLAEAELAAVRKLTANHDAASAAKESGLSSANILLIIDQLSRADAPLVLAGGAASASTNAVTLQVVVQLINTITGAVGKTVTLNRLRVVKTDFIKLQKLVEQLESDKSYDFVFVYNTNPAFSLPSNFKFNYALRRAGLVVSFSSHLDETARLADLILPTHTSLEAWGDLESSSGVLGISQPVMTPVFDTKQFEDLLLQLAVKEDKVTRGHKTYVAYLQGRWQSVYDSQSNKPASYEQFWRQVVENGGLFSSEKSSGTTSIQLDLTALKKLPTERLLSNKLKSGQLLLFPYPSVRTFDGRSANRPWMQELPDPVTKIVWGSWVEINPETAKQVGIKQGQMLRLVNNEGELQAPAYLTEYVQPGVAAVPIGNGHSDYGRYAGQVGGGNVLEMLPSQLGSESGLMFLSATVQASKGSRTESLVNAQGSDSQHGRHLAQTKVIGAKHDDHGHHGHHGEPLQMYEQRPHPLYKWGMAVDLSACTGCSACVVACYAENNIPVVGKKVFDQGREMSWLRIERYYEGTAEELQVSFLPMMCQHCGNAPCEPVCPVYATYHNEEGLNAMIYNRCVGTRYCGNNCSYKVRRFNWFEFDAPEPLNWQLNPDVVKRTAGVMEKCTFCVQRINEAKGIAKDQGRLVQDGDIKPACVQGCPTQALVFGDLNDPTSKVSKMAKDHRAYKVLDDHLNTQPAISYLQDVKYKI